MENKRYYIDAKNQISISFASIGNQVMFLDLIKYFQQGLASLANSLTGEEKKMIQKECTKFITIDESLLKKFKKFTEQDHECIVNYLFSGKGVILYEMITTFDLLNISPREGEFFFVSSFLFSS